MSNGKFNFDELEESTIVDGIVGKTIFIYGSNDTGKTRQMTKLPKPFLIMTEAGGSAVNCPKTYCDSWTEFNQIVSDMTSPKTIDARKAKVQTIIIDTVDNLIELCEKSTCNQNGVMHLSEIDEKKNGYSIYRSEFKNRINHLCSFGYTIVFIGHEDETKKLDEISEEIVDYKLPKGSNNAKSSQRFIRDLCDFVIYTKANGIDPETKETIPSSAICKETRHVFARSRFMSMKTFIEVFTANNIKDAIEDAVARSAEEEDIKIAKWENKRKEYTAEDYKELINPLCKALQTAGEMNWCLNTIDSYLGKKVAQAEDCDVPSLELIYNACIAKVTALGIEV